MCDRIVISTDGCFLFCGVVGEIIFVAVLFGQRLPSTLFVSTHKD